MKGDDEKGTGSATEEKDDCLKREGWSKSNNKMFTLKAVNIYRQVIQV